VRTRVRRYVDLVRMVAARFLEDRCTSVAASLTFTTLLSMVPLITVALSLIAAFPVFQSMMEHAKGFVLDNMVPQSVDVIAIYAEQFTENAGKLTAVGIAMLGATALLTLLMIDQVFNEIWRVPRPRPLLQRVLVYWVLLTIGPLLIGASLSLTSWLVSLSLGWVNEVPGAALFVLKVVPIFLTSFAFALLYATMPNRPVRKTDAVVGGITAGIGFEIMKTGLSLYIAQFPTYTLVYGAFAAIPVFLIWIYLSWLLILCGAVVTAVLPEWRDRIHLRRPVPGTDFFGALAMLRALIEARASGTAPTLTELAGVAALTAERAERILEAMAVLRWVTGTSGDRWVETRDAAAIRVGDVFRTFVLAPPAEAANDQDALRALTVDLTRRLDDAMNITLEELFAGTRGAGGDGAKAPKVRAV
jgi:membrane protein